MSYVQMTEGYRNSRNLYDLAMNPLNRKSVKGGLVFKGLIFTKTRHGAVHT